MVTQPDTLHHQNRMMVSVIMKIKFYDSVTSARLAQDLSDSCHKMKMTPLGFALRLRLLIESPSVDHTKRLFLIEESGTMFEPIHVSFFCSKEGRVQYSGTR